MTPDYEAMLEAVYRAALRPGDIALDVGAHTGRHSKPMADIVGPSGRVFAFEPLPIAFKQLQALSQAQTGVIVARNLAIGEAEGQAEFIYVPEFPEYSGFRERDYHTEGLKREAITVQVRRLDSMIDELAAARFLKVDIEGAELWALRGAQALIARARPILAIEIGNNALVRYPYGAADYFDFLEQLGYSVFSIFGLPLNRADFLTATRDQIFWDYIALPEPSGWPFGHDHLRPPLQQLSASGARIAAEAARAETAEARISQLLNSRSWRITAPIRRIVDGFRSQ